MLGPEACREAAKTLKLTAVPGIGEKHAKKLVDFFGSEERALEALLCGRVSLVAEAIGSPKRALKLAQAALATLYGYKPGEVFGNDDAEEIFEEYLKAVADYAASEPGKERLKTLFTPVPCRALKALSDRVQLVKLGLEILENIGEAAVHEIRKALSRLSWFKAPKPRPLRRVLAIFEGLEPPKDKLESVSQYVKVVKVATEADVANLVEEHGLVLVYGVEVAVLGAVPVYELTVEEVAPELIIELFQRNRENLEVLAHVVEALGPRAQQVLQRLGLSVDLEGLREALDVVSKFTLEGPVEGVDGEYDRLRNALSRLDDVASDVLAWANEEAKRRLEELEVRMSAAQLVKLLLSLERGVVEIPEEVYQVFIDVAAEAHKRLAAELELEPSEEDVIRGFVRPEPRIPLEVDEGKLHELRVLLERKLLSRRVMLLQQAAAKLKKYVSVLPLIPDALSLLDVALSLAVFVKDVGGSLAEVSTEYLGVGFESGIELALLKESKRAGTPVQRVSYVVGSTPYKPDEVKGERVVILTGANSGGKTTLLKTLAEIVLAAQAGLPVPALRAWVGCFDKVYFFSKPEGMLGAGALEEVLQSLARVATMRRRRLVLVDELEAVTEAHAAAKIVAGFAFSLARDRNAAAVIVSHLAEDILKAVPQSARNEVRVDGIEAKGLDENYNLIVDRQPQYYKIAKSTPELVATRLLHTAKSSEEREFYALLVQLLRGSSAA